MKNIERNLKTYEEKSKKIKEFSQIIENIEHASVKEKILWKEIYENAVMDRENAHILFVEAYTTMGSGAAEHSSLGSTLTKYIERMNKANDQLLKLAELIAKSEVASNKINADELFEQMTE